MVTPQQNVATIKEALVSIAKHAPRQIITTIKEPAVQYAIFDPQLRKFGLRSQVETAGLGMDPLSQPYYTPFYYGNPQLFKMPRKFRTETPSTPAPTGAFEQDTLVKALPFIAIGIAGIVVFNIVRSKKSR